MISETKVKIIYVDIETECNMNCTVCYQKGNEERDVVDINYFEEVCKQLSHQVFFRLIGGEPTLSPHILDFIKIGRKYNHIVTVVTNAIKLADIDYCRKLIDAGVSAIALSLNDDPPASIQKLKMKAFDNLIELDFKNIVLMSTILKNKNEHMIPFLLELGEKYGNNVVDMHFRNQYPAGKFDEKYNILFDDLKKMVLENAKIEKHFKHCHGRCCWIGKTKDHNIKISDGMSDEVLSCPDRGKLLLGNELKPFFSRMRDKEMNNDFIENGNISSI